ncbi:hypothetical protein PP47_gp02 [Pectobacterium phage PP47]|uniref:Uncharacterized protein n=2 Tax=Pektosvirus TaxID=2732689 RepID=A0A3B8GKC3_9CAUD|nr:hypothetical protein HOR48_gp02 [Pectobacterium phage PP81]YP_009788699.1 hypothetical protein HOR52_gp02 [Pectobacterium phage PP47]AYM47363.1 hypothetical protein PP47_gp02 [Pectobacterium phage PP47]AYM47374.1 hypothetical protein PP81_gp02 [Pectobacterium phage PP81]
MVTSYALIAGLILRDFIKGRKAHRAVLTGWSFTGPKFTTRSPKGRFTGNKRGLFDVATY